MSGEALPHGLPPTACKRTSALRRVGQLADARWLRVPGPEGCIGAFRLEPGLPIIVEAVTGRAMTLVPGDLFLATAGHRESTRWVAGGVPECGLAPDGIYWVLSESGLTGDLFGSSPAAKGHLGRARYLGAACRPDGAPLRLADFAMTLPAGGGDQGAPVHVVVGTSSEVGKTTAAIAILRALRHAGCGTVAALKATGTPSIGEIALYEDFGAAPAMDCLDFGMASTYPSGRTDIAGPFDLALDLCFSRPADAVLIECGGDLLGANVPVFLERLLLRRPDPRVVLAAADALGASAAVQALRGMGIAVTLATGPCTDTAVMARRTELLCGIPAVSMARLDEVRGQADWPHHPSPSGLGPQSRPNPEEEANLIPTASPPVPAPASAL